MRLVTLKMVRTSRLNPPEPSITINGQRLSEAQALTLRVALGQFQISLGDPEFRAGLGAIGDNYVRHADAVMALMVA